MKYMIVLGTRPEIIKFSPVIRELISRDMDFEILHTNQHYSYEMDQLFFEELELPPSAINLDVGSGSHGQQTGKMLIQIEKALAEERDVCLLVEGDTNTVAAGALVGAKLHVPVGHVEAGLRSFDRSMPEEINRVIADHVSDYLFAPTEVNRKHLSSEGIVEDKIFVVGNTIVDATYQNRDLAKARPVYQELEGWKDWEGSADEVARRGYDSLPENMKEYIQFISKETGVPPSILSLGKRRAETIDLRGRWGGL